MKTLNLKTPDVSKKPIFLENCNIIEVLDPNVSDNYSSRIYKVASDIPFQIKANNEEVFTETTEFINTKPKEQSFYNVKGTQKNQIIYIEPYKNISDIVTLHSVKLLKFQSSSAPKITSFSCIFEDIPITLPAIGCYANIDITLDLSKITGGSNRDFIIQNTTLKLLDISNVAKEFKLFQIASCYVGNINIVDFFADKTYSIINLQNSDFIGDICDLVERYFNSNKFLTFVFVERDTEITLHNKSLIGLNIFQIVITESGAIINKGNSSQGPFEETILTYNGSTWEGSWLQ